MGIFIYLDDLLSAIQGVQEKNFKVQTVFSPVHSHEITQALGMKASPVRYFTLVGAALGIAAGFGLAIYTAVQWRFVVSGKPPVPTVPYVIPGFEFCILLGVLWNVIALWMYSKLPRLKIPDYYDPRFSEDRFGILVLCAESEREDAARILSRAGAEEIHDARA